MRWAYMWWTLPKRFSFVRLVGAASSTLLVLGFCQSEIRLGVGIASGRTLFQDGSPLCVCPSAGLVHEDVGQWLYGEFTCGEYISANLLTVSWCIRTVLRTKYVRYCILWRMPDTWWGLVGRRIFNNWYCDLNNQIANNELFPGDGDIEQHQ